jgi:nucleoside-diphosphate-sugar epimerase
MIFQAYGPGQAQHTFVQAVIRSAMAGENLEMTTGSQKRDWIYLNDVVDGLVAALGADLRAGESFDLGTGLLTSLIDVANQVYRLVKRGGHPVPGGLPDRPGDSFGLAANVSRSTKLIGWAPRFTLEAGLKQLVSDLAE